jgi:arsenate reductase
MKKRVLFLCTTNSCRSQMAEGFLKTLGRDKFEVFSAGAKATSVNPITIKVMEEAGMDISNQKSKAVVDYMGQEFDYVITLCGENARRACPVFPGRAKSRLHWDFFDPAEAEGSEEERIQVFRKVRDQIRSKLENFVREGRDTDD